MHELVHSERRLIICAVRIFGTHWPCIGVMVKTSGNN